MRTRNSFCRFTLLFSLLLALAGCGYTAGSTGHQVLDPSFRKVAVDQVVNRTTKSWVEPKLRSMLRDEITRRGDLEWQDRAHAEALISLTVHSYETSSAVTGSDDETLRYDARMEAEAVVRSQADGHVLWSSGRLTETWPYFSGQETEAADQVTRLVVRTIVRRMSEKY